MEVAHKVNAKMNAIESQKVHLEAAEVCELLQKKQYVSVPFVTSPAEIDQAMAAFFDFLAAPEDIKNHIDFTIAPLHRRGDVGFRHRHAENHIYDDSKQFFHFHPAIFDKYPDFLEQNPVVRNLMEKAQPLWDKTAHTVRGVLTLLEPQFPGIVSKVFDTKYPHILLRFLQYEWAESGKYLAKPHYDAGSFTLAIAESNPGLRIGRSPEDLKLVTHKKDHAIFMLSSNFRTLINDDQFDAGWHDVLQMDATVIGKPFSRWALVAFIEAHGVPGLPRTETHKWYQPS